MDGRGPIGGVRRVAVWLAVVGLLLAGCGGDDGRAGGDGASTSSAGPPPTSSGSTPSSSDPSSPTSGSSSGVEGDATLPLGTLTAVGQGDCFPGATDCLAFAVECPGLAAAAEVELDVREATGTPRGVIVTFSASGGERWWIERDSGEPGGAQAAPAAVSFVDQLRQSGLTVVQARWRKTWLHSERGEDAGTARIACRPASVVRWAYDNVYVPLGVDSEARTCGFCITGSSGGASQVAYSLAFYGLDTILDVVIPVSGPPHANEVKGCMNRPGEERYWYQDQSQYAHVDGAYGVDNGTDGPCARHDPSFEERWARESIATGGRDYDHPDTLVYFVIGAGDQSPAPAHAEDYIAALTGGGSPYVEVERVEGMQHGLNGIGRERLAALLMQ